MEASAEEVNSREKGAKFEKDQNNILRMEWKVGSGALLHSLPLAFTCTLPLSSHSLPIY